MQKENLEETIRKLEDKVADIRDYISSDFCKKCIHLYDEIRFLEKQLEYLKNERNR